MESLGKYLNPEKPEYQEQKPSGLEAFKPADDFESRTYKELTERGETRREEFRQKVAETKSKIVESLGGSYIKAAFKLGKKAWTKTREETSRFVFSAPELAEHSMEFYRHAPDLAKKKMGETVERVADKVKETMERTFADVGVREAGFLPEAVSHYNVLESSAAGSFQVFEEKQEAINRELEKERQLNESYKKLLAAREENKKLRQLLIDAGIIV